MEFTTGHEQFQTAALLERSGNAWITGIKDSQPTWCHGEKQKYVAPTTFVQLYNETCILSMEYMSCVLWSSRLITYLEWSIGNHSSINYNWKKPNSRCDRLQQAKLSAIMNVKTSSASVCKMYNAISHQNGRRYHVGETYFQQKDVRMTCISAAKVLECHKSSQHKQQQWAIFQVQWQPVRIINQTLEKS